MRFLILAASFLSAVAAAPFQRADANQVARGTDIFHAKAYAIDERKESVNKENAARGEDLFHAKSYVVDVADSVQ
jgi:hypothetical protein